MGNVLSRCANEIASVFRNCRSEKSEDERKQKRNFESRCDFHSHQQKQHQADAEFEEADTAAAEHRELLAVGDACLPECDQTLGSHCPQSAMVGSSRVDNRDAVQGPRISKEFMIQTYRISRPTIPATNSTTKDCGKDPGTGSGTQMKNTTENKPKEFQSKTVDGTAARGCGIQPQAEDSAFERSQPEWKKEIDAKNKQRVIVQPILTNYMIKRTNLQPTVKIEPKAVPDENRAQRGMLQPNVETASTQTQEVKSRREYASCQVSTILNSTESMVKEKNVNGLLNPKHIVAIDMEGKINTVTESLERETNTLKHFYIQREASFEANTTKHLDQQRNAKSAGDKEEQVWKGRNRAFGSNGTNCLDRVTEQVSYTV